MPARCQALWGYRALKHVTLINLAARTHGDGFGCTGLKDYALTSALRDHRFSPMSVVELPALHCTVSLLCCFERANHWADWQVRTPPHVQLAETSCAHTPLPSIRS